MSGIVKPLFGTPLNKAHPLARGLVGCWLFNEGSGNKAYDSSGNENHGTRTGFSDPPTATSGWCAGPHGGAVITDGQNDNIAFGTGSSVQQKDYMSIIINIYPLEITANRALFTNLLGGYNGYRLLMSAAGALSYGCGKLSNGAFQSVTSSAGVLTINENQNIALTKSDKTISIYRNGINRFSGDLAESTRLNNTSSQLRIGYNELNAYWNALIVSNLLIYDRALSAEEIAYLNAYPYCMFEQADPNFAKAFNQQPLIRAIAGGE